MAEEGINLVSNTNYPRISNAIVTNPHSNINSSALSEAAKILTHSEYHSEEEINLANDYVDSVLNQDINENNILDTQYQKLAQTLDEYDKGNLSKENVEDEMLNSFAVQNLIDGASAQVINEIMLAYEQLGNHEALNGEGYGINSGDEISKYFETGDYGSAWCAMFVSWLNDEGQNNPMKNNNTFGFQESVASIKQCADEAGFYESKNTYNPTAGDIMVLQDNGCSHVGMVYNVDDEYVYTIEGNKCDMVRPVVYDKDGSYYQNCVSGYVKMNEWTDGNKLKGLNTEFLPEIETAILPETLCYPVPGYWDDVACGGFINLLERENYTV